MKPPLSALMGSTRRVADAKQGRAMRRWHVVVQLCAQGVWREYRHEGHAYVFRFRRDAERCADTLRETYRDPRKWNVSVVRRAAP